MTSDKALAELRPALVAMGFEVEGGKAAADKRLLHDSCGLTAPNLGQRKAPAHDAAPADSVAGRADMASAFVSTTPALPRPSSVRNAETPWFAAGSLPWPGNGNGAGERDEPGRRSVRTRRCPIGALL